MPIEDQRNTSKTDVLITIKEFNKKTNFNWLTEILTPVWKQFGSSDIPSESDYLHLNDVEYFVKLVKILNATSPQTVSNLIGWRLISTQGPQSSEKFRQIAFSFNKIITGVQKMPDRWESCYYQVNGKLGYPQLSRALSRLYVDKYFSKTDKDAVTVMVNDIQKSFHNLLLSNNWLDEQTRSKALIKLSMIKKKIGYSEKLSNNTELDRLFYLENSTFANELINNKNYIKSMIMLNAKSMKEQIAAFRGPSILNNL